MSGFGGKTKRCASFIYAAAILLPAVFAVYAQKLPFKNYTTADGLGYDRVERIVRDSRGFLWFCTGEGLSRFDGYRFKNYSHAEGLPTRRVLDLIETRDGKYFVATYAGIAIFNPLGTPRRWDDIGDGQAVTTTNEGESPMFRVLRAPDAKQDRRAWTVMDLLEDSRGRIWAATLGGLYWLEQVEGDWIFHRVESELWSDQRGEFNSLHEDRFGVLWFCTQNSIFRLFPDGRLELVKKDFIVRDFLEDRQGRIWAGSQSKADGLIVFTFPDGENKPVLARTYTMKDGLTSNTWLNDLLETSDGRILIGAANAVCEFLPEAGADEPGFRPILHRRVVSLAEDGGGNVWVGEDGTGATKFARSGFTLFDKTDFNVPEPYDGGYDFKSVFTGGSGSEVFFSADARLLLRFDGKQFTSLAPLGMKGRSWGWNQIDFRSRTGEWWIGDGPKILRYPNVAFEDLAVTKPLAVYHTGDFLPSTFNPNNENFRLFEDSRGDVWISAHDSWTIGRWERTTERLHVYPSEEYGIFGHSATAFAEDRDGNIWIGFYFGGLVRYHRNNGKFQMFTAEDGMPSGIVNAIYNDSAGRIWIATGPNGVLRVDNPTDEKPALVNLTTAEGLSSIQAVCFTEDNFGRIYVGTGRGVTRIDPQKGHIKIYGQADGLPRSHIQSCGRDPQGALWFSQKPMLARFVPEAEETSAPPPVFIGAVRINGETARKISELGETSVENLEFTSDQRQVQIDFLALSFGKGETLRYQYKLNNTDWSDVGVQRTVNLNLSPGSYHFLVRALTSEDVASAQPASVSFVIARPVWQRWWFLLALTLLVGFAIYVIYRYRIEQIIKLERVRTRIATDLHDDIGASLSKIAILSEVVSQRITPIAPRNNAISEPLGEIAGTSREMIDSMSDIVWAINPQRDHLSDLLQRMRNLAGEMTELCDIRLQVHLSGIGNRDLRLGADLRRDIYLIFKETINNMVKHSGCSLAEIEFRLDGDSFVVVVKDNGQGFNIEATGNGANRGGNGLPNMRRRAAALGGSYEIESAKGKGATSVLRVPLKGKMRNLSLANLLSK